MFRGLRIVNWIRLDLISYLWIDWYYVCFFIANFLFLNPYSSNYKRLSNLIFFLLFLIRKLLFIFVLDTLKHHFFFSYYRAILSK